MNSKNNRYSLCLHILNKCWKLKGSTKVCKSNYILSKNNDDLTLFVHFPLGVLNIIE